MLHRIRELLRRFAADESGATAIEYSLLSGGIALVIVAAITALGNTTLAKYTSVAGVLQP